MSTRKSLPPNPDLRLFRNRVQALVNDQESKGDGAALSVADARNLVAREYGFDDWDALRTAVEPATTYIVRAEAHKAALPPDHEFFNPRRSSLAAHHTPSTKKPPRGRRWPTKARS